MQTSAKIGASVNYKEHINRLNSRRRSQLVSFDLMRVISTIWVITIHSYNFALLWMDFSPETLGKPERSLMYQLIVNGTFSVDNFFFISGFLACWRRRRHAASPSLFVKLIWNRYARLMPAMMLLILISMLIFSNVHCNAPNWSKSTMAFNQWCSSNQSWISNLFMSHNIIGTKTMCLSHSWYLAADFQLFVAFMLVRMATGKKSGYCFATLIILAQTYCAMAVYRFDLPPIPLLPTRNSSAMNEFYRILYIKPQYWISSYFIGVLLADNFERMKRVRIERAAIYICLNLFICLMLICSSFPFFLYSTPMSREYATVYALLLRPTWSLNIASLLVMCRRVEWNPKLPKRVLASMSRLSFSAYLLHPILMAAFYGSRSERFDFSHYLMLYFTIGNIFLTYFGASFLYILIELPCQILLTKNSGSTGKVVSTYDLQTIACDTSRSTDGR